MYTRDPDRSRAGRHVIETAADLRRSRPFRQWQRSGARDQESGIKGHERRISIFFLPPNTGTIPAA